MARTEFDYSHYRIICDRYISRCNRRASCSCGFNAYCGKHGGVAGSQTLTVVVRGMALGQIEKQNVRWLFSKEFAVGILNGLCFSLVTGILVSIWFENFMLAVIVGSAMIINLTAAALSGTLVPIILKRIRVDPAVAGSVILTTITDVVGFVSFLGLSALLLI